MRKYQACLLGGLLMSGMAFAQDDGAKTTTNGDSMDQKQTEAKKNSAGADVEAMAKQKKGQILSKQLIDSNIVNDSDEEIGSITDIVMDKNGKVAGIIVTVGGFLGMGEKHVALPWDSVDITMGDDNENYEVTTALGEKELKNKPDYKTKRNQENEKRMKDTDKNMNDMKKEKKDKDMELGRRN